MFIDKSSSGLVGFVVALMPLSCTLMGWRDTNIGPNSGAANMYATPPYVEPTLTICSGAYFFIGGPFLLISGLLEFFLGNTFTFVVFISYG